jgi:hypothetical protein
MKAIHTITILFILISVASSGYTQLSKQYADSARLYNDQKNTDKAIELYTNAKEELKKDSAETNSYVGICDSLANLYYNIAQYQKAEPLYLESETNKREKVWQTSF